jgi:hypothetical protein
LLVFKINKKSVSRGMKPNYLKPKLCHQDVSAHLSNKEEGKKKARTGEMAN